MLTVKISESLSYEMCRDTSAGKCNIAVMNISAPTMDGTDDMKDSFYNEFQSLFAKLPT